MALEASPSKKILAEGLFLWYNYTSGKGAVDFQSAVPFLVLDALCLRILLAYLKLDRKLAY